MDKVDQKQYDELFNHAVSLLEKGERGEPIVSELLGKCDDIILVSVVIKEAKNNYYAAMRKQGFRLVLIGCALGMAGMIITLFNFVSNRSVEMAMYGFTLAGIVVVLWGVFKIIG